MVLTTIFVTRHGFRSNWSTDRTTGKVAGSIRTPTAIPSDVPLTAYGVHQAEELATQAHVLQPPIARVYTSPFYRCVQTIYPLWSRLSGVPLESAASLGEWYGKAPFEHDTPASAAALQRFFPGITALQTLVPDVRGETIHELHERCAKAMAEAIAAFDAVSTSTEPESLMICSHAAPIIAIGRALTGDLPEELSTADFDTHTCSISRFERRHLPAPDGHQSPSLTTALDWKDGKGVGGGWTCTVNAGVDHLQNGGERNWHFHGDESFVDFSTPANDRAVGPAASSNTDSKL